jgi:hypothetical protein
MLYLWPVFWDLQSGGNLQRRLLRLFHVPALLLLGGSGSGGGRLAVQQSGEGGGAQAAQLAGPVPRLRTLTAHQQVQQRLLQAASQSVLCVNPKPRLRIRIPLFTSMRIRIQLLLKLMGICVRYPGILRPLTYRLSRAPL